MKRCSPYLILLLLAAVCFTLATLLQPRAVSLADKNRSGSALKMLLGDGRRLFANHFYIQADVAFHGGYYPSIFDQKEKPANMAMAQTGEATVHDEREHEREMALDKPRDWIERFGRNFRITEHSHLAGGDEREMLPWLKISAELDPQRVETYTVASYWLRKRLKKPAEAEEFLREGLKNNPDSYEILYELGRLHAEDKQDLARARNIWERALNRWEAREAKKKEPDFHGLEEIAVHLADAEEKAGNYSRAMNLFQLAAKASPSHRDALNRRIEELKTRLNSAAR